MTPEALPFLAVGIFGLLIGSFLNVYIYRIPRPLDRLAGVAVHGVRHERIRDANLPVVSYLMLREVPIVRRAVFP